MNSKQGQKLKMFITVRDYLTKFLSIFNVLPNFQVFFTALQNVITQIQGSGELQELDKSGNATNKKQARDTLIKLIADTASKLVAYASFKNNQVLLAEVNATESSLKRLSDVRLRNVSQGIYDRAQENIADLPTYMITPETQTALQKAITDFYDSLDKPRLGTTQTSTATKLLRLQFKTGDAALKDLDTIAEIIRNTQVEVFYGYKSVRKITNSGSTSLAIKGLVTDAATGLGVKGVKVTLTLNGASVPAVNGSNNSMIVKKSAKKGGFMIATADEGTYAVTAEIPGYKKAVASVVVVAGQRSKLNIRLEKE